MSRYIDWGDVTGRYSDAAKFPGGAEGMKDSYINAAEAEVDGRLAAKYAVPFTPVPDLVSDLCIDLAYLKLILRQPEKSKPLKEYLDGRFTDILNGKLLLTVSGTLIGTSVERAYSTAQNFESSFGVDAPERWAVDSNWQDNFASRRGYP